MPNKVEALVKSDLLVWAREDAGYSLEEAAKKIQVKPEKLASWEQGESRPSIIQLRNLARAYKRPLAVFFLSKPPKRFQAMHDFRRLPGEVAGHESPGLRFEIKRARFRRQVAIDLYESLAIEPPRFNLSTSLSEEPEAVAERIRSLLGIRTEDQANWKNQHEALNSWRSAIESQGVLVFQTKEADLSEMRGFSISEFPLPVIAVNIKDAISGRIFTALHELCHLMLHDGGVCDLTEASPRGSAEQKIEIFCNAVAGSTIAPGKDLLADPLVKEHGGSWEWSESEISSLARRFWSSRETVVRRLLTLGHTNEAFYRRKRTQYQEEYEQRDTPEGFAPPYTMALTTAGNLFTRLVLDNYYRENITSGDLAEFLDVRLKHVPRIEQMMLGRPVTVGETE